MGIMDSSNVDKTPLITKFKTEKLAPEDFDLFLEELESVQDVALKADMAEEWAGFSASSPKRYPTRMFPDTFRPAVSPVRRFLYWALAVCLLAVCGVLGVSLFSRNAALEQISSSRLTVKSGKESPSLVYLPDGSLVCLNACSTLKYSPSYGLTSRVVELNGEAFFEVKHRPDSPFIVVTPNLRIHDLGTKFNVNAYPFRDIIETSVLEGSVGVDGGRGEVVVSPGDKAVYDKGSGAIELVHTDMRIETAWMGSNVIFSHDPLCKVFEILEHRFGVQIQYPESLNTSDLYTGAFADKRVEDILNILRMHYGFKYSVIDDHLIIIQQ